MINITTRLKNILLLLGFFIFVIIIIGDIYYINNNSHDNLHIENNTHYNIEDKTKIILTNFFCIDSIYIKYEYMDEQLYIDKTKISAYVVKNAFFDNQYLIYVSKTLKPYYEDIMICHELIHIYQFETNQLVVVNLINSIYLYNDDTLDLHNIPYLSRQFEIDAYNMEDSIYNELQILVKSD